MRRSSSGFVTAGRARARARAPGAPEDSIVALQLSGDPAALEKIATDAAGDLPFDGSLSDIGVDLRHHVFADLAGDTTLSVFLGDVTAA